MTLVGAKCAEIVFSEAADASHSQVSHLLYWIYAVNPESVKVLGVTTTNQLAVSVSELLVMSSADARNPRTCAFKVLRSHGMNDESLTHIYKADVLSKLLYASPVL